MKIYIGFDFEGNPTGVLLSDSREKVEIVWAAMKDTPHSIEEIDPNTEFGLHNVVFLLTSEDRTIRASEISSRNGYIQFRKWKRGL